jgi:hypothetical protein
MNKLVRTTPALLLLILSACSSITYTPHSPKKMQKEKPSVVLLNAIIEYREEQNAWPFSKEEFVSKGKKYKDAFVGFPYSRTAFKVIDNNTMVFSFYDHVQDVQNYQQTNKTDFNSYWGEVKFFKEKDKFIWKLKMK